MKVNKIKCVNIEELGIVKLTLYNESELGEEVSVWGVNEPFKTIFTFPIRLLAGEYRLEIETYFTIGITLLKNLHVGLST